VAVGAVGAVGGSWRAGFNTKNTEVTKGFKEWFCARGGGHGMTRMITEGESGRARAQRSGARYRNRCARCGAVGGSWRAGV
jgi:hypothetical protein